MKVKCISDKENKGYIKIGKVYTVYSIMDWGGQLSYLLSEGPYWYPADQFEIINSAIPGIWHFSLKKIQEDGKKVAVAFCGYKEMVDDFKYHTNLIDGKKEAIDIFIKRKGEIDEYEELSQFERK